jgi:pyrroline-5-carboxylate reductase
LEREIMQSELKIAFIGGGNMAQALIGGLAGKLIAATNIHVIDVMPATLKLLSERFGVTTAAAPSEVLAMSDVIVLAVKPQQLREVVAEIKPFLKSQLVLSIAAGIRAADISRWLGGHQAIVRTMPNTPALIGQGITGAYAMSGVSELQKQSADALLRAVGETVWVTDEAQIDAVTAISGSGPAYVFYFIEAMQKAATELGLSAEQGRQLAQATFAGAAALASQSDEDVSLLRERVTSKGGTTYAALTSMEASGVKAALVKALHAAADRGRELGDEFGKA